MLSAIATIGRQVMSWLNHTVAASGAPQFLQNDASLTTTGSPHWEQKRGRSTLESGMEGENRVAELENIAGAEWRFGNALFAEP